MSRYSAEHSPIRARAQARARARYYYYLSKKVVQPGQGAETLVVVGGFGCPAYRDKAGQGGTSSLTGQSRAVSAENRCVGVCLCSYSGTRMAFDVVQCSSLGLSRTMRPPSAWPLKQLQPGQCFVIPMDGDRDEHGRSSATVRGLVSAAGRRLGLRFSVTKLESGDLAVSRWE